MKRILSVDYGRRRLGMAVSDSLGIGIRGIATTKIGSIKAAVAAVARSSAEHQVAEIVVGIPLNMDGSSGPMATEVESFAGRLERETGLPVARWDERLTTVAAHRSLREMKVERAGQKEEVDRMSAVLILQGYLNRKRQGSVGGPDSPPVQPPIGS